MRTFNQPVDSPLCTLYNGLVKLASIIIVIAFFTLPTLAQVVYVTSQILAKGIKGAEDLFKPSPALARFSTKYGVLFFFALSAYASLFVVAIGWMFYEVFVPSLGLGAVPLIFWVWTVIFCIAESIVIIGWSLRRTRRLLADNPRPPPNSPETVHTEWQIKYENESSDGLLNRSHIRMGLMALAVIIIWFIGLLLIALLLK